MVSTKKSIGRIAGIAAATLATTGIALSIALPAQAASSNCPSGYACVWEDDNYVTNGVGANLVKFENYIPDYSLWDYSSTTYSAHDTISSLYNNGNLSSTRFFESKNHGGWYVQFSKKKGSANLNNNGANDDIDSGYFSGLGGVGTF